MKIMGVDPGLNGGLALLEGDTLRVVEMPVTDDLTRVIRPKRGRGGKKGKSAGGKGRVKYYRMVDAKALNGILEDWKPDICFVELVHSMSGQGVVSIFSFGMSYGIVRGLLDARGIETRYVRPAEWKSALGLTSDKNLSIEVARNLWPDHATTSFRLKKHDGLAEAALISEYGRMVVAKEKEDAERKS